VSTLGVNSADRLVVVHADDAGKSDSINRGVQRAYAAGMLTSLSVIANGAAYTAACDWIKTENLSAGLHLNLTEGAPLLTAGSVPTLVQRQGHFTGKWGLIHRLLAGRIRQKELAGEIRAQIERLLKMGLTLNHLDSHHHVHLLPPVAAVAAPLAREYGIGWIRTISLPREEMYWHKREGLGLAQQLVLALSSFASRRHYQQVRGADHFWGMSWYHSLDKEKTFQHMVAQFRPGINEWMCHPGCYQDTSAEDTAEWHRGAELEVLCAPETRNRVLAAGVKLISIAACLDARKSS